LLLGQPMENTETKDDYVSVGIPKELAEKIDKILESGTLGYRSRAELANEATRRRIEQPNPNNLKKLEESNYFGLGVYRHFSIFTGSSAALAACCTNESSLH
jgi:metal-responsive CopG/Arc/MetJ family transcriptional regulator